MGVITDLRGRRSGRLTVPETAQPVMKGGRAYWPVICECGARKLVRGTKLREGSTVSCGCERADPEVRSAARRGPEDDHQDDALEALRPYFEPDEPPEEGIEPEACRLRPPCEKSRGSPRER